ncbi:hypothetical protein ERD95_08240 [Enterobacteriaceae bacterium ML5]|nr:hypothetical protein ERD95_08240 [Enterobacteriaceae bacterium ML5]
MEIKTENVAGVIISWAAVAGREYVAAKITESYFALGGSGLKLRPVAEPGSSNTNMQNIFRWLKGDTAKARDKTRQLIPAIVTALPSELKARLLMSDSIEYRALQAVREKVNSINASLDELSSIYIGSMIAELTICKPDSGSSGNRQTMH